MIDVRDLRFRYGDGGFELVVPRLVIGAGRKVALIGPSGSGKTTLVHLVAGIRKPLGGRIVADGFDVVAAGERQRRQFRAARLGLVFQEFELLEYLTVRENILLPHYLSGAAWRLPAVRREADALAASVGLGDKVGRHPTTLSQGERQRVAIARALVTSPRLILADEPTGNLDPDATAAVLRLLLDEVERRGATLVMVTHNHGLLGAFDQVIAMEDVVRGGSA